MKSKNRLLVVGLALICSNVQGADDPNIAEVGADFKKQIGAAMTETAKSAKLRIDANEISYASMNDLVVAAAPVIRSDDARFPIQSMLAYIGLGGNSCSNLRNSAFYVFEQHKKKDEDHSFGRLVDMSGNTVADNIEINEQNMRMPHVKGEEHPDVVQVEAVLKESAEAMVIIIILHVKSHHTRAGWVWWSWDEAIVIAC